MERSHREGFTLVELMIVIVVLAILAGIVIPQFLTTSDRVRYMATRQNLQELRDAIQLYRNQHLGRLPGVEGAVPDAVLAEQLTLPTNVLGERSTAGDRGFGDPNFPFGPYVPNTVPRSPFNHSILVRTVREFPTAAPGGVSTSDPGWIYEITSGRIRVNWDGRTPKGDLYWDL